MGTTQFLGHEGEKAAADYLVKQGLRPVARHFQTRWGEIDLIFRDRDTWVFVEVKFRKSKTTPSAADAVTPAKQKKLIGAALSYMKMRRLEGEAMRFDVLLVEQGQIEWIPGAFEASSFYTF